MADVTRTSRDQDNNVAANWTTREITDHIDRGDPEALAEALRPFAARLANQAGAVTDPGGVLLDLGHVVDSIRAAVTVIVARYELAEQFDTAEDAPTRDAVEALVGAVGALDHIGNNI